MCAVTREPKKAGERPKRGKMGSHRRGTPSLQAGTVTFLFSDIQGSTQLLRRLGARYQEVLQAHHRIIRRTLGAAGGELKTEGDSFFFVFSGALDAVRAAAAAQRALAAEPWPEDGQVRVRMGLHTGEAPVVGHQYVGLDVHRAARIAAAAHGGQVLLSESTRTMVDRSLPADLQLVDLGLHRLKDLAQPEHIFQLQADDLPGTFPPLKSVGATPNNLPTQLTSFIGRTVELDETLGLLLRSRLLTLTGPGGTGKTRLALQIAAEAADDFPDGLFFVALAPVRDSTLVPSMIAQALNVTVTGTRLPQDAVIDHLQQKRLLLILDNFEQLMPAAPTVASLLQASPTFKILATSRAVLHISGEQEYSVPPLRIPDIKALPSPSELSRYEAVKLFIERAVSVKHDFQVTNQNAPAIAGICERLDGLPLAIELAAARIKLFSPPALLARLEKSLSVLASGGRELLPRKQTLEGAIGWSVDLLDDGGRRLLARFSVFARGADLEQAERICGPKEDIGTPILDALDQLADQSLVRRLPEYDEPRFLMLQVIREFATERLEASEEAGTIRERHASAYLNLAREAEPHFGDLEKGWLDRLERNHDNFRAALEWWTEEGNADAAMQLASLLWRFWQMRGHLQEGRASIDRILGMAGSRHDAAARKRLLEAAGGLAYWQADMSSARRYYDEALELSRAVGDPDELANALYNDAFPNLADLSNLPKAKALLVEAMEVFRARNDRVGIARVLWATGLHDLLMRDTPSATTHLDEAVGLFRSLNRQFDLGWALRIRGLLAIQMRDPLLARRLESEALGFFRDSQDVSGIVMILGDFSAIAALESNWERALVLNEAAAVHRDSTGALLGVLSTAHVDWPEIPAMGDDFAGAARTRGKSLALAEAVAYALEPASPPSSAPFRS